MSRSIWLVAVVMVGSVIAGEPVAEPMTHKEQEVVIVEPELGSDGSAKNSETVVFAEPTIVRILGSVRAGGTVSAKILGSGKLLRKATVRRMSGGHYAIGAFEQEFDVQLSTGTTTVVLTSRVPQDKALTQISTYTFTVGNEENDEE